MRQNVKTSRLCQSQYSRLGNPVSKNGHDCQKIFCTNQVENREVPGYNVLSKIRRQFSVWLKFIMHTICLQNDF